MFQRSLRSRRTTLTLRRRPTPAVRRLVTVQLRQRRTANGGSDTSAQTFTINVTAVNDAPTFVKGADQAFIGTAPAQSIAGWASAISAGPADEAGQTLTFTTANDNIALFSAQPAVGATGTLTFTPIANVFGVANVTVTLTDSGGTANGGANTSVQTFKITIAKASTTTTLTTSSTPAPFGAPVTLSAKVTVVAPGVGVATGSVTFKDGGATLGTAALVGDTATLTTSALSIEKHTTTEIYAGGARISAARRARWRRSSPRRRPPRR
jgi:hypothetical protein